MIINLSTYGRLPLPILFHFNFVITRAVILFIENAQTSLLFYFVFLYHPSAENLYSLMSLLVCMCIYIYIYIYIYMNMTNIIIIITIDCHAHIISQLD